LGHAPVFTLVLVVGLVLVIVGRSRRRKAR
jgi:hypothetical protein